MKDKELINDLYSKLDQFKGYEVGSTSECSNKMILDRGNKRYIITVEEITNPNKDMLKDIKEYLE